MAFNILIVNTGYHRYAWDQPDVPDPAAQGGGKFSGALAAET